MIAQTNNSFRRLEYLGSNENCLYEQDLAVVNASRSFLEDRRW